MTTIIDGTQKGIKLHLGDYVHFGDNEVYQLRGNGNHPQLYLDAELTQARTEAMRIYHTAERVLSYGADVEADYLQTVWDASIYAQWG